MVFKTSVLTKPVGLTLPAAVDPPGLLPVLVLLPLEVVPELAALVESKALTFIPSLFRMRASTSESPSRVQAANQSRPLKTDFS